MLCVGYLDRRVVDAVHGCNLLCQVAVGIDVLVITHGSQ
jgi:hypothetical protein